MSGGPSILFYEPIPAGVRIAQCAGITLTGYLLGQTASFSTVAVPVAMEAPAPLLARQWKKMFDRGKKAGPGLAVTSSLLWGYLAYREPRGSPSFKLYIATIAFILGIVPYTRLAMMETNIKLIDKADSLAMTELTDKAAEAGIRQEETTHALVDKWATLNMGRAGLVLIGTLCGVWGTLTKMDVLSVTKVGLASGADRLG